MREFTEQELVRREKAEKLRTFGLDPFGDAFERDSFAAELKENEGLNLAQINLSRFYNNKMDYKYFSRPYKRAGPRTRAERTHI